MIAIKHPIGWLLSWCFLGLCFTAQSQHLSVFPPLPFDLSVASSKGYANVSARVATYTKSETDEPGYMWSIPQNSDYQFARYAFFEGKMQTETHYNTNGDKTVEWEYSYRQGLLSVIDEVYFDSTQKKDIRYMYVFHYDAQSNPFQKVIHFNKERNFRLLYDYTFDKERRPVREKITASGVIEKWDNITNGLMPGRQEQMTLVEYRSDVKILRVYENMHQMIETYKTQYDLETKLPQRLERLDANHKVLYIIDYDYEGEQLMRETQYRVGDEPEPVLDSMTHYYYNEDGLIDRKLVEKGDLQTVYSYGYFNQ